MLDAARPHLLRIIGPNCLGVMVPGIGLNASFGHIAPLPGAHRVRHPVGRDGHLGRRLGDGPGHRLLAHRLARRHERRRFRRHARLPGERPAETHAILLYVEAVTHARKFMSAARAAARSKPVIVVKAGRHEAEAPGGGLAHRRAGRLRRGLRRRLPARRHAARVQLWRSCSTRSRRCDTRTRRRATGWPS